MRKILAVAVVALAVCLGCTTVAKQAYYTATGPQGSYLLIQSPDFGALERYRVLEVASFENAVPTAVGRLLADAVQTEIVKEMSKSRYFARVAAVPSFTKGKAEAPTIVLRGTILDITIDQIPGQKLLDQNYLLAVVELVDKETGAVLGKANVRGVVKSVLDSGQTPLAEGMARGVKRLFKDLLRKTAEE